MDDEAERKFDDDHSIKARTSEMLGPIPDIGLAGHAEVVRYLPSQRLEPLHPLRLQDSRWCIPAIPLHRKLLPLLRVAIFVGVSHTLRGFDTRSPWPLGLEGS